MNRKRLSGILCAAAFGAAWPVASFAQFNFPTGACCLPDGSCIVTQSFTCTTQLGNYQGDNTSCAGRSCSGACCLPTGDCIETGTLACLGSFKGLGTTCDEYAGTCVGACCGGDGSCTEKSSAFCSADGGTFFGNGTVCGDVSCLGACCLPDGTCALVTESDCTFYSGVFNGPDTVCEEAVCPLPTQFTYQGRLTSNGQPINGFLDLRFSLWSDPVDGQAIGAAWESSDVHASGGLFTTNVDFGVDPFNGRATWLEVEVRDPAGSVEPYVALNPRQPLSAVPYALQTRGIFVNESGLVGIGTSNPTAKLDVNGMVRTGALQLAAGAQAGRVLTADANGVASWQPPKGGPWQTSGNNLYFVGGSVGVGTENPAANFHVIGTTRTNIVEITGGSDIAEPYTIASTGGIEPAPGMVVSIDPDRIGRMRVASEAYDQTVAGIVSGANGVNPGLTLRQEGSIADGDLPVASVGRVWCLVDADAGGPVRAGDLLTTSPTPGHAMKVSDPSRAHGAIIGKAMSSLDGGRGMVLVLVTLH